MTPKIIHLHRACLKLLIERKSHRVLFAEAEKEFIDFRFTLLALPVAAVTKLLKNHSMVGCIGNLYDSVESLSDTFIHPGQAKNNLLNPILQPPFQNIPLLLQHSETGSFTHAMATVVLTVLLLTTDRAMQESVVLLVHLAREE